MKTNQLFKGLAGLIVATLIVNIISCNKDDDEDNETTNTAPTCSITSPSFGDEITQGETITISVEAEDEENNLKEVRFYIDGTGVGSSDSFPYNYEWETTDAAEGSHTIKAVARDEEQAEAEDELEVTVVSGGEAPVAAFSVDSITVEEGTSIQFTDESTGEPTQWQWDFGDGNTSAEQNPMHTYSSEGAYDVELAVENDYGRDTETKSNYIEVSMSSTFTDARDGQTYEIVQIGNQVWFAENLNYEKTGSLWYDSDPDNGDLYGRLYHWDAALDACPDGWHLPKDYEWKTLEMELGMSQSEADDTGWRGTDQGEQMKSTSGNGTNSSGFSALPGGYFLDGSFSDAGHVGYWWVATDITEWESWFRALSNGSDQVFRSSRLNLHGMSVRCLKD